MYKKIAWLLFIALPIGFVLYRVVGTTHFLPKFLPLQDEKMVAPTTTAYVPAEYFITSPTTAVSSVATTLTPAFSALDFLPTNAANVKVWNIDFEGDGTIEKVVMYVDKVHDEEKNPLGLWQEFTYIKVFKFKNNAWSVIKEDHGFQGESSSRYFNQVKVTDFGTDGKQELVVSSCSGSRYCDETYYVFAWYKNKYQDLPISKAYLHPEYYFFDNGSTYGVMSRPMVTTNTIVEQYVLYNGRQEQPYFDGGFDKHEWLGTMTATQEYKNGGFVSTTPIVQRFAKDFSYSFPLTQTIDLGSGYGVKVLLREHSPDRTFMSYEVVAVTNTARLHQIEFGWGDKTVHRSDEQLTLTYGDYIGRYVVSRHPDGTNAAATVFIPVKDSVLVVQGPPELSLFKDITVADFSAVLGQSNS